MDKENESLEKLAQAGVRLAEMQTPEQLLICADEAFRTLSGADSTVIYLNDNDGHSLKMAHSSLPTECRPPDILLETGELMMSVHQTPAIIRADAHHLQVFVNSNHRYSDLWIVAISFKNQLYGVAFLFFLTQKSITRCDELSMHIFTEQLVAAIQNKRLADNVRANLDELDHIAAAAENLQSINFQLTMKEVLNLAQFITGTRLLFLWYKDLANEEWLTFFPENLAKPATDLPDIRRHEGIIGQVLKTKKLYICHDVSIDPCYYPIWSEIQSEIAVPLIIEGEVVGVLDVESTRASAFGYRHAKLLTLLSSFAALAVRNHRIVDIADQKTQEVIILKEIVHSLGHRKSLDEVLQIIADESLKMVGKGKKTATVLLLDEKKHMLETRAIAGDYAPKQLRNLTLPLWKKSILTSVAKTRCERLVNDVMVENDYLKKIPNTASELCVPFFFHEMLLGVINIESSEQNAFTEQDVERLKTLGESAALSIKIGELIDIYINQLETLNRAATRLSSSRTQDQVLTILAEESLGAIGKHSRNAYIQMVDLDSSEFVVAKTIGDRENSTKMGSRLSIELGISGQVFRSKTAYLSSDVRYDPFYVMLNPKVKSEICVPIFYDDKIIGVITLESIKKNDFGQYDIQLLNGLASQAGATIENMQLNTKLLSLQYELNQAVEMASIGETLAGLSHDIRTSNSLISGEAQWIERRHLSNQLTHEETLSSMRKIKNHVSKTEEMLTNLSQRAHGDKAKLVTVHLRLFMEEVLQMMHVRASEAHVNIMINPNQFDQYLYIDPHRMIRVFLNIFNNAVEAMPNGGTFSISGFRIEDNYIVEFSDTGIGLTADELARVWKHFYTTKPGGWGLGLTVCRRIVETDHQGEIDIRSESGKGTTITISLPISGNEGNSIDEVMR